MTSRPSGHVTVTSSTVTLRRVAEACRVHVVDVSYIGTAEPTPMSLSMLWRFITDENYHAMVTRKGHCEKFNFNPLMPAVAIWEIYEA